MVPILNCCLQVLSNYCIQEKSRLDEAQATVAQETINENAEPTEPDEPLLSADQVTESLLENLQRSCLMDEGCPQYSSQGSSKDSQQEETAFETHAEAVLHAKSMSDHGLNNSHNNEVCPIDVSLCKFYFHQHKKNIFRWMIFSRTSLRA